MARKTNKTAHVLNLISKAKEEHQPADDEIEINSVKNNITNDLSFMDTEITNDQELGEQIKDNLTKSVEDEAKDDSEDDVSASIKTDENLITNAIDVINNNSPQIQKSPSAASTAVIPDENDAEVDLGFTYVNVLEEIVKLRVDEFIEMFEVCDCPRCRADIIALSLNYLPPKYIVVDSSHVSPLLNFFSHHYSGAVAAQLSRACSVVKDNPHHKM